MADIEYYEDDSVHRGAPAQGAAPMGAAAIVNWIGALLSVGLIVGMGVWAWQLTVRDVSDVPVIRALEGPMRVAPDDPGGSITTRQGLTVNRITEGAVAEPAADRIVLAPAPLDLEEIDLSSASLPEATAPVPPVSSEETMALIDRLLEEAVPLEPLQDMPAAQASLTPMRPVIEVISTSIPGPSQSIRPPLRPESLQVAATAAAPAAPSAETTDLDAATLAVGTRLVQLGAFDDAETARSEWDRLARANPDFFRDKGRVIQQAVSGGREFFRLRAHGFTDLSDARRFCTALNARGAPCIPVTVR
jgi:SPOR domain